MFGWAGLCIFAAQATSKKHMMTTLRQREKGMVDLLDERAERPFDNRRIMALCKRQSKKTRPLSNAS
jgi:hypothetical protein